MVRGDVGGGAARMAGGDSSSCLRLGARGVEPSVLARQWVIDQLDAATEARDQARERWERDIRATTEHLRRLLDERPGA